MNSDSKKTSTKIIDSPDHIDRAIAFLRQEMGWQEKSNLEINMATGYLLIAIATELKAVRLAIEENNSGE